MLQAIWFIGVFAAGVGLGVVLRAHFLGSRAREREQQLERALSEAREEQATYRGQVSAHFDRTAELFRDLTHQHAALYRHLAGGARELASPLELSAGEEAARMPRVAGSEQRGLPGPDPWSALLHEAAGRPRAAATAHEGADAAGGSARDGGPDAGDAGGPRDAAASTEPVLASSEPEAGQGSPGERELSEAIEPLGSQHAGGERDPIAPPPPIGAPSPVATASEETFAEPDGETGEMSRASGTRAGQERPEHRSAGDPVREAAKPHPPLARPSEPLR